MASEERLWFGTLIVVALLLVGGVVYLEKEKERPEFYCGDGSIHVDGPPAEATPSLVPQ